MRKINISEWTVRDAEGKEGKENLLQVLSILVTNKKPEELPRGLEQFKLFNKLVKAFEKAEATKVLELEEKEYQFLKNTIDRDIPSIWGTNKSIVQSIDLFYNAPEE
jgi:F0F1-type ATP synthase delta subunit